jgi:hypothetical protein
LHEIRSSLNCYRTLGDVEVKLRNLFAGGLVATALLMTGSASAGTLPIGGYAGPLQLNFNNYEDFLTPSGAIDPNGPQVGDQNIGIFAVQSITVPGFGGKTLWAAQQGGIDLLGVFNGITVQTVTGSASAEQTTNTGGVFQLYSVAIGDALGDLGIAGYAAETSGTCNIGDLCYHGVTDTPSSQLVLTMTLTPGIDGTGVNTLDATVNATLNPPTGNAAFHGLISDNTQLLSLVSGKDSFCPNNGLLSATCSGADGSTFSLASQDPITGTAVPEPASLVVMGSGLLFLYRFRARRRK